MSIYNEYVPSKKKLKPFKTVTIEYFEEFDKDTTKVSPKWQEPGGRRIRVVTTTRRYNLGSSKPIPVASVTYEYL
jgi:hypothetical protein